MRSITVALDGTRLQIEIVEWLFKELDKPIAPSQARPESDYTLPGDDPEKSVKLFFLAHTAAGQPLNALATQVRVVTKARRLFVNNAHRLIAVRGTPAQLMDAAKLVEAADR